jgi:hypothetical protein
MIHVERYPIRLPMSLFRAESCQITLKANTLFHDIQVNIGKPIPTVATKRRILADNIYTESIAYFRKKSLNAHTWIGGRRC